VPGGRDESVEVFWAVVGLIGVEPSTMVLETS
jgi:hypothetical protein